MEAGPRLPSFENWGGGLESLLHVHVYFHESVCLQCKCFITEWYEMNAYIIVGEWSSKPT